MIRFAIALLLTTTIVGCQKNSLSENEMRKILNERNEALGRYFKAADADSLALMYADSAKLCPDGNDIVIGRDAIKKFWSQSMNGPQIVDMKTETVTVDGTRDVIYETGRTTLQLQSGDSVQTFRVKFANVWKLDKDGQYKLDVDIWNNFE